ncbi:MAG TPA: polyribonucleotide nucleotidyltransferase, partial [Saprospiraceae bacterium]|nr:polyribonucleotide nucleotidyltransferase [Saprospiraceae bacterium]
MGKQTPITHTFNLPDGTEVTIETGKLATQADGSALVRVGNTMILATAVSAKKAKEGQSFFPLSVDYQEKFASAGRIPGNFFRRETRLSDYEVLISRLVDRAIRPLFPDGYMNETQIIINLISAEKETLPDAFVALAASAALTVSDIPFDGPISEVRVARINGEYVINPSKSSLEDADLEFIVAATTRDVMMVEGEARECQEEDLVQAIKVAHEAIKVQIEAQHQLAQKVGGPALNKRSVEIPEVDTELYEKIENQVKEPILEICRAALSKHDRKDRLETLLETFIEGITEEQGEEYIEENGAKIGE